LPEERILDLFNTDLQPGQVINKIQEFLATHMTEQNPPSDIIFYYCGHGAYLKEREYFLALKCTNRQSKEPTIFKMGYLVEIIADYTRDRRNLVILDACYSGGALIEFANLADDDNAAQILNSELVERLQEERQSHSPDGEPAGTVLFCAAGPKNWAKTPLEAKHTMFSGALVQALSRGDIQSGPYISLKRLADLVRAEIKSAFGAQGVLCQIHVPTQGQTDLLELSYFPNPAFDPTAFAVRLAQVEADVRGMRATVNQAVRALKEISERPAVTKEIAEQLSYVPERTATYHAVPSGNRLSSPDMLLPIIITIFFIVFVNGATLFVLDGAAVETLITTSSSSPVNFSPSPFNISLLYAVLVHGIVAFLSAFFMVMRRMGLGIPILGLFPRRISYVSLFWNSVIVIVCLSYFVALPTVNAANIFAEILHSERAAARPQAVKSYTN
jgi:hypothetical protein